MNGVKAGGAGGLRSCCWSIFLPPSHKPTVHLSKKPPQSEFYVKRGKCAILSVTAFPSFIYRLFSEKPLQGS